MYYYIYVHYICLQTHQKRVLDLITDGCEPPCGCWDLNSGPSKEQSVLLSAEPSHQPWFGFFVCLFVCFLVLVLVFRDKVSLCSPGCPGTHSVDQAGLELRNPPASASQVLRLKACATMPSKVCFFLRQGFCMYPWLSWNLHCRSCWPWTQRSACLCLLRAGIKGMCHWSPPTCNF